MTVPPQASLDRRLRPRPLPLHLASAIGLWWSCRAALTSSAADWTPWNSEPGPLRDLVREIRRHGIERVGRVLDDRLNERANTFLSGLEAYRAHPFRRDEPDVRVIWQQGGARLLDYGRPGSGRNSRDVVLLIPSLINRYYILDLLPERSFARFLAEQGLRPLVLDWGEPGPTERAFGLDEYIADHLENALTAAVGATGGAVAVAGYCMGGLLALALALRRPSDVRSLSLLATPWHFHAERAEQARYLASLLQLLPLLAAEGDPLPVAVIQGLFTALDPFLAERKFIRFAGLARDSEAARDFVALEDWINDGVPLARKVALECARSWYHDNDPGRGRWQIAGENIAPERLSMPALAVLPGRDRIVPPGSASALAAAIPGSHVMRPPLGHIGMMSSARAPELVWRPLARWLAEAGRRFLL